MPLVYKETDPSNAKNFIYRFIKEQTVSGDPFRTAVKMLLDNVQTKNTEFLQLFELFHYPHIRKLFSENKIDASHLLNELVLETKNILLTPLATLLLEKSNPLNESGMNVADMLLWIGAQRNDLLPFFHDPEIVHALENYLKTRKNAIGAVDISCIIPENIAKNTKYIKKQLIANIESLSEKPKTKTVTFVDNSSQESNAETADVNSSKSQTSSSMSSNILPSPLRDLEKKGASKNRPDNAPALKNMR